MAKLPQNEVYFAVITRSTVNFSAISVFFGQSDLYAPRRSQRLPVLPDAGTSRASLPRSSPAGIAQKARQRGDFAKITRRGLDNLDAPML